MRFILVAHGLINQTGHHYMEARAFKKEAARRGLDCLILAHRHIEPEIRAELDAYPLFEYTPYKKSPVQLRFLGPLLHFRSCSRSLARKLLELPPETIKADDLLVSPLTKAAEMSGLAQWLAHRPREQRPFLAINFMIDDISRPLPRAGKSSLNYNAALFYRFAFHRLRKNLAPKRLLLSAGGSAFARAMSRVLSHPVQVFPLPVQHELAGVDAAPPTPGTPPLIVFLGHMQPRKGSDLAGAVVRRVLDQHPACQFLLQANPAGWESHWLDQLGPDDRDRVRIHCGELTQEEYQKVMSRAALVLLPYRPAGHILQTSGVFSEAMAMGKVSIIPEGTWMADMARRYGGGAVVFRQHNVEAVAAAVLAALENLPELTRDMAKISSVWRETMGMKAFVRCILDAGTAGGLQPDASTPKHKE